MIHPDHDELNILIEEPASGKFTLHLYECEDCRKMLDDLRRLHRSLLRLEPEHAPDDIEYKVLSRINKNLMLNDKMPLFVKVVFTTFIVLIIAAIIWVFSATGNLIASGEQSLYNSILNNYSNSINASLKNLTGSKIGYSILLASLAIFTMSLYFLFEKIKAMSK